MDVKNHLTVLVTQLVVFLLFKVARKWGKIAFVGEGNSVEFEPSRDIIHDQKTIYGSWVTNIQNMELLVEKT